ncbi:Nn.00g043100.m01.CDS01 [Neocucurbitaria sp. VM-36]
MAPSSQPENATENATAAILPAQVLLPLTFKTLPPNLPLEIRSRILYHWMSPQLLLVSSPIPNTDSIRWTCTTDSLVVFNNTSLLPRPLAQEYKRLRKQGWLTGTKAFDAPYDFYMSHYLLGPHLLSHLKPYAVPRTAAWRAMEANANIAFTSNVLRVKSLSSVPLFRGFESITLDFSAEQYFAFFRVSVAPFNFTDNRYHDALCRGAAAFLQHAKTVTLRFGAAYKERAEWAYGEARFRPRVCESRRVVDWILGYAWHHGFLQHVAEMRIEGDVQEWVKRKWCGIFEMQAQRNRRRKVVADGEDEDDDGVELFAVFKPDIDAIETIGMVGGDRDSWRAEEFYPPACTCEIGCWRLVDGTVEEERPEMSWDDVESGEDDVVGDWDDADEQVAGWW